MAYNNFSVEDLQIRFGITNAQTSIFGSDKIMPVVPSEWLRETLAIYKPSPKRTEKARSEMIVVPILFDIQKEIMICLPFTPAKL